MCLVLRLIVGGVQIGTTAGQTGVHDGQVLVGQGEVDDQIGLVFVEQRLQLFHVVGIYLCGLDVHCQSFLVDGLYYRVTFLLAAACNDKLGEHVSVLCNLVGCHGGYATCANH